jgi:hypothetical protein
MNQPEEWPLDYHSVAGREANKLLLESTREACQRDAVRSRYGLIRNANLTLREIAAQNEKGRFRQAIFPAALMVRRDDRTGKSLALYDPLYAGLLGEELDYVKTCPRCEEVFFAPRVNSIACEKCREAYRKRQQREEKRKKANSNL